jgi:hypothetical protein
MLPALESVLLVLILVICLFAFVKGEMAERIGAGIILANLVAGMANESLFHSQLITLCIDGLTAFALLPIVLRYASLWLGAVMLLYAAQFALHAFYFVAERPRDTLHIVLNNTNFVAVGLCLAVGTAGTWVRRHRRAAADRSVLQAAP